MTGALLILLRRNKMQAVQHIPASERDSLEGKGQISPDEIEICKRPDGSEWILGTGSFGQVRGAGCRPGDSGKIS